AHNFTVVDNRDDDTALRIDGEAVGPSGRHLGEHAPVFYCAVRLHVVNPDGLGCRVGVIEMLAVGTEAHPISGLDSLIELRHLAIGIDTVEAAGHTLGALFKRVMLE